MISRRVWVEDNGQTGASPSLSNVQTGSAADMQRIQNNAGYFKPPGGSP